MFAFCAVPATGAPSLDKSIADAERRSYGDFVERRSAKPQIKLQLATQLAVFLDNRPGTLGRMCEAFAQAKINIFAISSSDTVDHIVFRMVVSDPTQAKAILEERGTLVLSTDVLMIDGTNKPGSLAEIANKLGAAKINIEYAYSATHPTAQKGILILRVSDPRKALKVLNS
jgi:hypothetical protein